MNDTHWFEDYRRARELSLKYETAKKYGATVPGNRKRENQTILVPRGEVIELAKLCALRAQTSGRHLEKFVALWAYVRDVVKITPGHLTCEICGQIYIPLPENSECPFCRIERMSAEACAAAIDSGAVGKNNEGAVK